ncbi:30S ribosome-binding factor RbfA [Aurantibacter sp.]|uniref:30S ribosome-binding factor RbfA n=1 Tax=Aurantibacter sp. TaxID=2807103 RepID=UPI0035C83513
MEETQRQKKIGSVLQKDLVDILQKAATQGGMRGIIISVSKVKVTVDLGVAKVYISIFPNEKGSEIIEGIKANTPFIRHEMAQRTRNQLRRMPNLEFFLDDSIEFMSKIDQSLKRTENPIKDPSLLDDRKKG